MKVYLVFGGANSLAAIVSLAGKVCVETGHADGLVAFSQYGLFNTMQDLIDKTKELLARPEQLGEP